MKRRTFLQAGLTGSAVALAATAGLLSPSRSLAANLPGAFTRTSETDAIKALFGNAVVTESDAVVLTAPINGNPQAVAIEVDTKLNKVESIAIAVANNPQPLCTVASFSGSARGFYSTRIKVHETSPVTAYVKAGGKVYSASAKVKIATGGYIGFGGSQQ